MKKVQKNTTILILALSSVFALLVVSAAYTWLFFEVRSTVEEVALKAQETQLLTTQNSHTQTVRRVVRDTEVERGELESYFVTEEGFVQFLEDIETLGEQIGLSLTVDSVSAGKAIDKDKFLTPLTLNLKTQGPFASVFHMLELIEAFPKVILVDQVRFTQHPTTLDWVGTYQLTVIRATGPNEE